VIFNKKLTLNFQQLRAFEDSIKLLEKPVVYEKRSQLRNLGDQELQMKILNIFDSFVRSPYKLIHRASRELIIS